jgi:hypothetical protein
MHHVHALVLWGHGDLIDALQATDACLAEMPQYWPARLVRVYSLAELGRLVDARRDAAMLLELVPRMTARGGADEFADTAPALRERACAAALAAGLPGTPPPTVAA